ncbi:probable 39S ribosomal protein L49, mitochondrial [Orussus abietinus]|uniref:probable 39S ribosomal protein L49, mitochondrial n=1 Tax=Orussus abietinus TaxID=222816 RepID=UPI0006265490|nr:probable 39S ribosomal protein L49, mitochondrial [Orussus abietinus]
MAALRIFARLGVSAISRVPVTVGLHERVLTSVLQKRWSSFTASPKYDENASYPDFEVSRDPQEWKCVEDLLAPKLIPAPPSGKEFPSGWRPQNMTLAKKHPYFVARTKNHMQPVYLLITFRGVRKITTLNKIQGNIWKLEAELKEYIEEYVGKKVGTRINEATGQLRFRGDYVLLVKEWLTSKGF